MRLQAPRHVVEGPGQDAYFVVGIMFHGDGALTSRNTVRCCGQTPDRIGQAPDAVDSEEQCNPQAESCEDRKPQRDHPFGALELLEWINEIEHDRSHEGGRLTPLAWLVQWYGRGHGGANR